MTEATIEIQRDRHGVLDSVSVVMPIWDKEDSDGSTILHLPFFALKLYAFDDIDANDVINNAIKGFCFNCEKFGLGLESELELMGWTKVDPNNLIYKVDNFVYEQMVHTGDKQSSKIELQPELSY